MDSARPKGKAKKRPPAASSARKGETQSVPEGAKMPLGEQPGSPVTSDQNQADDEGVKLPSEAEETAIGAQFRRQRTPRPFGWASESDGEEEAEEERQDTEAGVSAGADITENDEQPDLRLMSLNDPDVETENVEEEEEEQEVNVSEAQLANARVAQPANTSETQPTKGPMAGKVEACIASGKPKCTTCEIAHAPPCDMAFAKENARRAAQPGIAQWERLAAKETGPQKQEDERVFAAWAAHARRVRNAEVLAANQAAAAQRRADSQAQHEERRQAALKRKRPQLEEGSAQQRRRLPLPCSLCGARHWDRCYMSLPQCNWCGSSHGPNQPCGSGAPTATVWGGNAHVDVWDSSYGQQGRARDENVGQDTRGQETWGQETLGQDTWGQDTFGDNVGQSNWAQDTWGDNVRQVFGTQFTDDELGTLNRLLSLGPAPAANAEASAQPPVAQGQLANAPTVRGAARTRGRGGFVRRGRGRGFGRGGFGSRGR